MPTKTHPKRRKPILLSNAIVALSAEDQRVILHELLGSSQSAPTVAQLVAKTECILKGRLSRSGRLAIKAKVEASSMPTGLLVRLEDLLAEFAVKLSKVPDVPLSAHLRAELQLIRKPTTLLAKALDERVRTAELVELLAASGTSIAAVSAVLQGLVRATDAAASTLRLDAGRGTSSGGAANHIAREIESQARTAVGAFFDQHAVDPAGGDREEFIALCMKYLPTLSRTRVGRTRVRQAGERSKA